MTRMTRPECAVMCNLINTHTHSHTDDQCEWHRMTRMTRPDCAVMCNLINTYTHTYILINGSRRKVLAASTMEMEIQVRYVKARGMRYKYV